MPECGKSLPELEPRRSASIRNTGLARHATASDFANGSTPTSSFPIDHSHFRQAWSPSGTTGPRRPSFAAVGVDRTLARIARADRKRRFTTPGRKQSDEILRRRESRQKAGTAKFDGLEKILNQQLESARSEKQREALTAYRTRNSCSACHGARLKPESLAVRFEDLTIDKIVSWPSTVPRLFSVSCDTTLCVSPSVAPLVREIAERLSFLNRVGLSYLTLDRAAETLSGGELQRVRLGAQVGSGLVGIAYVLDERPPACIPAIPKS